MMAKKPEKYRTKIERQKAAKQKPAKADKKGK
jgi:hypothetical protein